MRKRKVPARRPGLASLAGRLALVIAALLLVRELSDRFDSPGPLIPDKLGVALLTAQLPGAGLRLPDPGTASLLSFLPVGEYTENASSPSPEPDAPVLSDTETPSGTVSPEPDVTPDTPVTTPDSPAQAPEPDAPATPTTPADTPAAPEEPQNPAIGTTITGESGDYTDLGGGIYVKNRTDYKIDAQELLAKPLAFTAESSAVLIVHTHGSEAYNPAGEDIYEPSDPSRTEDKNYNVIRLGDELERILVSRGITVYHDRELHDYPSYAGSYERTLKAIQAQLDTHPEICVVIDLHRDALEGDGKLYKTVAHVGDTPSAQVMLICGTNFSGLKHPGWRDNLSFALKLQKAMVTKYPTLARPLKISEYRYNQHATPGSLILEVGTNGNTLQEALTALTYFGDCMAQVLTD